MRHDVGPRGVHGYYKLRAFEALQVWKKRIWHGLRMTAFEYNVTLCFWCDASGEYDQFQCDVCKGACLLQNGEPAPASIVMQVYEAGSTWSILE